VRLLGVSLSQLEEPGPTQGVFAFDETGSTDHARVERRAAVEHAVDAVRDRFGSLAVGPASLVKPDAPKPETSTSNQESA
jgi:hypothetical protein